MKKKKNIWDWQKLVLIAEWYYFQVVSIAEFYCTYILLYILLLNTQMPPKLSVALTVRAKLENLQQKQRSTSNRKISDQPAYPQSDQNIQCYLWIPNEQQIVDCVQQKL